MKKSLLLLLMCIGANAATAWAQDDDVYFVPSEKRNQARSLNIRRSMLTILTTRWLMTMTFKKVIGQKDGATATGMLTHTTDVAKITKDSVTRKNRTQ